jgi:hypothetical protein
MSIFKKKILPHRIHLGYLVKNGSKIHGLFRSISAAVKVGRKYRAGVELVHYIVGDDNRCYILSKDNSIRSDEFNFDLDEKEAIIKARAIEKLTFEEQLVLGVR